MKLTRKVKHILNQYEGERPGVKLNLARFLMQGRLGGSGKLLFLAVDQGFEHGPRAFVMNPEAFDPHYHFRLGLDAGLSGYAAPLGFLEAGSETYLGSIPTVLKINSGNSLTGKDNPPDQAVTATIDDALRLGCSAIGFTIYPSSDMCNDQIEEIRELAAEAKSCGLAVIMWSYPRGAISKAGETALDVIAYGAQMACQLGAHIVKVKMPTTHLEMDAAKGLYEKHIDGATSAARVKHIVQSCFNGRRMVIFSGGEAKDVASVQADIDAIKAGGGNGAIIGRNCFQRPRQEAMLMLNGLVKSFSM